MQTEILQHREQCASLESVHCICDSLYSSHFQALALEQERRDKQTVSLAAFDAKVQGSLLICSIIRYWNSYYHCYYYHYDHYYCIYSIFISINLKINIYSNINITFYYDLIIECKWYNQLLSHCDSPRSRACKQLRINKEAAGAGFLQQFIPYPMRFFRLRSPNRRSAD